MALYTYDGKIILNGGKLANNVACCCGAPCVNDATLSISAFGGWYSGDYTLPNSSSCYWEGTFAGGCGGVVNYSKATLAITCDAGIGGGSVTYTLTLYETLAETDGATYTKTVTGSPTTDCTVYVALDFDSTFGSPTCGPYAGTTIYVDLSNNNCCTCCSTPPVCESSATVVISGSGTWDGTYTLPYQAEDCLWSFDLDACTSNSRIEFRITSCTEGSGITNLQVNLIEDHTAITPQGGSFNLVENIEGIDCTELYTIPYTAGLSYPDLSVCGNYDEITVTVQVDNNDCCPCCVEPPPPCCNLTGYENMELEITASDCASYVGLTVSLTASMQWLWIGTLACPEDNFQQSFIHFNCTSAPDYTWRVYEDGFGHTEVFMDSESCDPFEMVFTKTLYGTYNSPCCNSPITITGKVTMV